MHQFSLHTQAGSHLGFLVMTPENGHNPVSGELAVKLLDDLPPLLIQAAEPLAAWAQYALLYWEAAGESVSVYAPDGSVAGSIRQELLTVSGSRFVLNHLTGTL